MGSAASGTARDVEWPEEEELANGQASPGDTGNPDRARSLPAASRPDDGREGKQGNRRLRSEHPRGRAAPWSKGSAWFRAGGEQAGREAGDRSQRERQAGVGRVDRRARQSAYRARGGESHLASPVRARSGPHARQLRQNGRTAQQPAVTRLPGIAVYGSRMVG